MTKQPKLLLKQMGIASNGEREYEVAETSDVTWECGEILSKSCVKELCRRYNVRIIQGKEDQ